MSEQNKELWRQFTKVWDAGDRDSFEDFATADTVGHQAMPGSAPGLEGMKQLKSTLYSAFPDRSTEVHNIIAEGDRIAALHTLRGTHLGDFHVAVRRTRNEARVLWSAQFGKTLGDDMTMRKTGLLALANERDDGGRERRAEGRRPERSEVCVLESGKSRCGKVVVPSRQRSRQALAKASERERVIADRADVVLGLPEPIALDARACMQRIDNAPAEDVSRDRGRGDEEIAWGRRHAGPGLDCDRAEQKPEARPGGSKLRRRAHRNVQLKRVREQEYPIRCGATFEVDEVNSMELLGERVGPVIDHVGDRDVLDDAERKVYVREGVTCVDGEGADQCSGHHALVPFGEPEHVLAERITLVDGEH